MPDYDYNCAVPVKLNVCLALIKNGPIRKYFFNNLYARNYFSRRGCGYFLALSLVCANENMWQADSTTQIKHFAASRIWKCQHQHRSNTAIAPASQTTTTTVGKGRSTYFFAIKIKCYQLKCSTAITSVVLYLFCPALGCWMLCGCGRNGERAEVSVYRTNASVHTHNFIWRKQERASESKMAVIALSFGSEPFFFSCKCQHFSHNGIVGDGYAPCEIPSPYFRASIRASTPSMPWHRPTNDTNSQS